MRRTAIVLCGLSAWAVSGYVVSGEVGQSLEVKYNEQFDHEIAGVENCASFLVKSQLENPEEIPHRFRAIPELCIEYELDFDEVASDKTSGTGQIIIDHYLAPPSDEFLAKNVEAIEAKRKFIKIIGPAAGALVGIFVGIAAARISSTYIENETEKMKAQRKQGFIDA